MVSNGITSGGVCEREVSLLSRHAAAISAMTLSPSGRAVVSGDSDGVMIRWDVDARREEFRVHGARS